MKHARVVPVLMYHHVSPVPGMITVSPEHFEDQLRWLKRHGYRSLSCDQFAGFLAGEPVPPRSVLITFDDGYLDNWVYAYPLLERYGYRAALFVVTGWVGQGEPRPHAGKPEAILPSTPSHADCERLVLTGRADQAITRWSELRAMKEAGVFEVHSHTHTHTRWDQGPRRGNKNALMAEELEHARTTLRRELNEESEHFCWPQGYYDREYQRIAQAAGYRYLYSTQAFGQNCVGTDPAAIYRFAVRNTTGASVGRRIRVATHPWIGPLFNRWKRWRRRHRESS